MEALLKAYQNPKVLLYEGAFFDLQMDDQIIVPNLNLRITLEQVHWDMTKKLYLLT